jgi:hypothetical protein
MTTELLGFVVSTMERLNCPRSLTLAIMARHGMWREALELPCEPAVYADSEAYFFSAQSHAFIKKLDCIPGWGARQRRDACVAKWWESEHACAASNLRLKPFLMNESTGSSDERIYAFIERVRKNVLDILGESLPLTWEGKFGPGATVSDNKAHTTVPDKTSSIPTFTPNALYHLVPWSGTLWATSVAGLGKTPKSVRGNSFFTVPKDSTIDRPCAKEPSINGFFQLGLGAVMKRRLARAGLDLQYGKEIHMQAACRGSLDGLSSTIDLSSASDTVCRNLVKLLLPPRWFQALDSLRSPTTLIDGKTVVLEKFSSMGNGFTFELETTLFAAIVQACVPGGILGYDVLVFGDDMIVPTSSYVDCVAALRFFGFKPNLKKSFGTGPFRESCGGDYYNGVAVRPHFQEIIPNEPQHYISLANGLRRSCMGGSIPSSRWAAGRRLWHDAVDKLPSHIRSCRGPSSLGDIVLHSPEWRTRWRSSIGYVRVYRPLRPNLARVNGFSDGAILAACTYGAVSDPPWSSISGRFPSDSRRGWALRGATGYKLGWTAFS